MSNLFKRLYLFSKLLFLKAKVRARKSFSRVTDLKIRLDKLRQLKPESAQTGSSIKTPSMEIKVEEPKKITDEVIREKKTIQQLLEPRKINFSKIFSNKTVIGAATVCLILLAVYLIVPFIPFGSNIISENVIYSDSDLVNFTFDENNSSIAEVKPNATAVNSIVFKNVNSSETFELKVADIKLVEGLSRVYSIDPTKVEFDEATVTVQAQGNTLFKCKDWDAKAQECKGRWKRVQKINPGEVYSFTLTPEDPGFGEDNDTVIVLDKEDYLIPSSEEILRNDSGTYDIKVTPTDYINDTINELVIYDYAENQPDNVIKINDELNDSQYSRLYAIDPTAINFTEAVVNVTASNATKLMKCANWNFTAERCGNYCEEGNDSCETNETWTEVASIVEGEDYTITLSANDPAYAEYKESEGESSTSSTSYQNKVNEVFTPAAGTYLVIATAQLKGSSTSYSAKARVTIDGTTEAEMIFRPVATSNYETFVMHKVVNLTAASHTINIDYASSSTFATAYIKNARVTVFNLNGYNYASSEAEQAVTTSYAAYNTLTFTPATAENYLIIATGEYANKDYSDAYTVYADMQIDGVTKDEAYYEPNAQSDYKPFAFHNVSYLSAESHTITIRAREEVGYGYVRDLRISAIPLTIDFAYNSTESNSESSTTSTSYQDKTTLEITPATEGSYMFIATAEIGESSISYSPYAVLEIDGAVYCEDIHKPDEVSSPRDYYTFACSKNITLDATTHTAKIRYKSSSTSGTAYIRNARITAFRLLNNAPTTPNSITCNGGTCNSTFYAPVNVSCSGSTDVESDAITYSVDGYYNQTTLGSGSTNVSTSCRTDTYTTGHDYEFYSKWTIPGSGTANLTAFNFYDYDGTLSGSENIQIALYADGGGYSRLSEIVTMTGAGSVGWITKDLTTPIEITLGQTYWIAVGPSGSPTYSLARDANTDCADYPPTGTGSYYVSASGGLDSAVPTGATQSVNKYIIGGINYVQNNVGYSWTNLGTHSAGNFYAWNQTNISDQTNISLRCRAIDLLGSNTYSSDYSPSINMTKSSADVVIPVINSVSDSPDPVDSGQVINITANVTDNTGVSSVWVEINSVNYTMTNDTLDIWYYSDFNTSAVSAGLYNYTVYANDTWNNNATAVTSNFTINVLVSLSLSSAPINFTNANPGQLVNATESTGFPLVVLNNGNVNENITISGQNLTGQTNPSYIINVNRVNWALTSDFGTNYNLTATEDLLKSGLAMNATQNVYFRLYTPMNVTSQNYQGNVTLKAYQA